MIEAVRILCTRFTMILNLSRLSLGLPSLCLALLNACGTAASEYQYTVYRGTFVDLPRLNSSSTKPDLVRNEGVLWVSSEDGRIKGHDWQVSDDASFQSFMSSHGWTDADATDGSAKLTKVKVVKSNDEQNQFFFPGFIGTSVSLW